MSDEVRRTLLVSAAVCGACSLLVASSAVLLRDRQERNREIERQRRVLAVAGVTVRGMPGGDVLRRFSEDVEHRLVEVAGGQTRTVYFVRQAGQPGALVLPVEGPGLWSTLRGFLALSMLDANTVEGITFYEHGETAGLGAEIDNPRWQARWKGRRAFDENGQPALEVIKHRAGSPDIDPHRVDGIAGASLTADGVSRLVRRWLGDDGYGPFLASYRAETEAP